METPQIFLVDKRLHRKGELYPVENLQLTRGDVNNADEVSFTYYREVNGKECESFYELDDLSVIEVRGYGFFECSVSEEESSHVSKSVSAQSLGHSELSQILATLDINTGEDTARNDYDEKYPTVLYRELPIDTDETEKKKLRESSLLHRILTYAPHYKIGSVSETLCHVQRTFSWENTDIISILNDVAQEINGAYEIELRRTEDNKAERILHFYDMQYCKHCWEEAKNSLQKNSPATYRNIINGVCQNCNSSAHVTGIGTDTDIFISTDNLSDEITIDGDKDSIKNCFKIVGGDDSITQTVQGLNMSASNRITMFSDAQRKDMSRELVAKLDEYDDKYAANRSDFETLLETEYNLTDLILYLENAKMPPIEKEFTKTDDALYSVLEKINTIYHNKFFISRYEDYINGQEKYSIRNTFTTFMPPGYSFTVEKDSMTTTPAGYNSNTDYRWYGKIKVYSTGNREDSYTLHVTEEGSYVTKGMDDEEYQTSDTTKQNYVDAFYISFSFADKANGQEYRDYLTQHTQYLLSTVDLSPDNEIKRNWGEYCYNRLDSYDSGYLSCIDSLRDMQNKLEEGTSPYKSICDLIDNYSSIRNDIHSQMLVLKDQITALRSYLSGDDNEHDLDIGTIFSHMVNSTYTGGYDSSGNYTVNEFIGTKPILCNKCGSTNVSVSTTGNICNNPDCGGRGKDIYTYLDMMKNVHESYTLHRGNTIHGMREAYRQQFDLAKYLGNELYSELLSFVREDTYQNDNYTSTGLSNAQLIKQAKELMAKAEQELSKACTAQYTITTSLSSAVWKDKLMVGNFVRVQIDDIVYRMRISSISYSFPVSDRIDVTFTNVSTANKTVMQDISEIMNNAANMATSYSYIATQAEKGEMASKQFDVLKNEGLDAGLIAVKAGQNQDIVIDEHGILLRKKDMETDKYDSHQMRMINRNIVMTEDNWEHAKMAIGLGMYGKDKDGNPMPVYGVWADVLVGDLMVTEELHVKNDNESVIIDEHGITLDGGAITWKNKLPSNSVEGYTQFKENIRKMLGVTTTTITENSVISPRIGGGYLLISNNNYSVEIDPDNKSNSTDSNYLFAVKKKAENQAIMGVTSNGTGYFSGKIIADTGQIGNWKISDSGWLTSDTSAGISWDSSDKETHLSMNGDNFELSKGNTVKFRINTYTSKINDSNNNSFTVDVGYIDLMSTGNINLESKGRHVKIINSYLDLSYDNYITTGDLAVIGESQGRNIWVGACTYNETLGREAIFLNAAKIRLTKYATLYTPDGTVSSSDRRIKREISDMDSKAVDFILKLKPSKYKLEHGNSGRYHFGFIAQDVEKIMNSTIGDAGLLIKSEIGTSDDEDYVPVDFDNEDTYQYGLRYEELIAPMVATIQNLNDRIQTLEHKIQEMETNNENKEG